MKIFAIFDKEVSFPGDRNTERMKEWLSLPDSAMMRTGKRFYLPDFDTKFMAFPAIGLKIDRLGKTVAGKFASRYVSEITAGFIVVACDSLESCRQNLSPWSSAVVFDGSCWIGEGIPAGENLPFGGDYTLEIRYGLRGEKEHVEEFRYREISGKMVSPADAVAVISERNTIKIGDMILDLLPGDGIRLEEGMSVKALIDGREVFSTLVK